MITGNADSGIRDPDNSNRWLVPPSPVSASFGEVVRLFTRHSITAYAHWNATQRLVFYEGYLAAMDTASKHELTNASAWRWHEELRGCVANCVEIARQGLATEGQPAPVRKLPAPSSARRQDAIPGERAS